MRVGPTWQCVEFGRDPYAWQRSVGGGGLIEDRELGGWIVADYRLARQVLAGPRFLKAPDRALPGPYTDRMQELSGSSLLFMDPPDHGRIRATMRDRFRPAAVKELGPSLKNAAVDAVRNWQTAGTDFVAGAALPYAIDVLACVLGVRTPDREMFVENTRLLVREFSVPLDSPEQRLIVGAKVELVAYLLEELEARQGLAGDLLGDLIGAQRDGRLSAEEMISAALSVLVAGVQPMADALANGVYQLAGHADQQQLLRSRPDLLANAVEEVLRHDSSVTLTDRVAAADLTLGRCPVQRGQWMFPALALANHDARVSPAPTEFDISRPSILHSSFGAGAHYCLGAGLARAALMAFFETLLQESVRIDLADTGASRRSEVPASRGFVALWIAVAWR
ncbi:cytochrome P450 [Kribbella koreensis]|uniref:Cytochrome P450 n=1 Tax=Kribbella koreensis TaxID=57909 RepID=A0ABN1RCX1_9ACTN